MGMRWTVLGVVSALVCGPVMALADPVEGVWQTEPDRKDLTSHIEIHKCDQGYCGRVLRAFDPNGSEVVTKNVGKQLFWGMAPEGAGVYGGGTVWVPLLNITTSDASMTLAGNTLRVEGRKGLIRGRQTWVRVE